MTAPDPGLTDLIAAHSVFSFTERGGRVCNCGWTGLEHPAHVAEMLTTGRTAEPETTSEGGKRWYVNEYASVEFDAACDIWLNEVDPYVGDSGHARKLAAALHAAATAADDLRAALEGEQQ